MQFARKLPFLQFMHFFRMTQHGAQPCYLAVAWVAAFR